VVYGCSHLTMLCGLQFKPSGPGLVILLSHVVCACVGCVAGFEAVCARHISGVDQPPSQHANMGLGFSFLHTAAELGQNHASCSAVQPHCKHTLPLACNALWG
jgi:hypothetical protein